MLKFRSVVGWPRRSVATTATSLSPFEAGEAEIDLSILKFGFSEFFFKYLE